MYLDMASVTFCDFLACLQLKLGKASMEKENVFFRALPESPNPPLTPIRATSYFFSDVKLQNLKVT